MKGHSSNTSSITPASEPPKLSREDESTVEGECEEAAVAEEHSESAGFKGGAVVGGAWVGEKRVAKCEAEGQRPH
jgi:hypothetical protein